MSEISYDTESLTPILEEVETSAEAVVNVFDAISPVDAGAATEVVSDILTGVFGTAGGAAISMAAVAPAAREAINDLQMTEAEIVEMLRLLMREGE